MKKLRERILFYAAVVFNWSLVFGISWFADPRSWPEYLDRMIAVLPTVLIMVGMVIGLRFILTRFRLPAVETVKVGQLNPDLPQYDKSLGKKAIRISFIITCALGPIVEELLFRLPLLLFFSELSSWAWAAILTGAVLFMAPHLPGHSSGYRGREMINDQDNSQLDLKELTAQAEATAKAPVWSWILRITTAFLFGLLLGYVIIITGSLCLSVVVHIAINIAMLIVLPILAVIIGMVWMFTKDRIENR